MKKHHLSAMLMLFVPLAHADGTIALDPVSLQVVDAASGEPVKDVVVVISYPVWREAGRSLVHGPWYEQSDDLRVAEALTDAGGRAAFEGASVEAPDSDLYLRHDVPWILVYKAGYQPLRLVETPRNDNYKGVMDMPAHVQSRFEGMVIRLEAEPAGGLTDVNVNQAVGFIEGDFRLTENCRWSRMPTLLESLTQAAVSRPRLQERLKHLSLDSLFCIQKPAPQ